MKRDALIIIAFFAACLVAVYLQGLLGLHQAHDPMVPNRIPGFVLM